MKAHGLFHGSYDVGLSALAKETPRSGSRAFVLPGQGAAFPGMFNAEIRTVKPFVELFNQADALCPSFDLLPVSLFVTRPAALPSDRVHVYRNCAIFVAEVAMGRYLEEQGLEAQFVTGHSFGECAALVLGGVIDFETMFSVVVYRNLLAPPANQLGKMVAISASEASLPGLLDTPGVFLANKNSHKQYVLSVAAESHDQLMAKLRAARVPNVVLYQLPQPYHSPLMNEFRESLRERLSQMQIPISAPRIPIFSGVSHAWIDRDNYRNVDFVDLLARQVTETVDFVGQLEALAERAVTSFYEVGPGKMLETSIRAVLKDRPIAYRDTDLLLKGLGSVKIENSDSIEKFSKSKWFEKIKVAIKAVAGYKTEDIQISHSFQNDLGIDSIKKAEILFKIINAENVSSASDFSIAQFNTIYQAVEYLESYSEASDPLRNTHEAVTELMSCEWVEVPRAEHLLFEKQLTSYETSRFSVDPDAEITVFNEMRRFAAEAHGRGKIPAVIIEFTKAGFAPEEFLSRFHEAYARWMAAGSPPQMEIVLLDRTIDEVFSPIASFWKSLRKEIRHSRVISIASDRALEDREIVWDLLLCANRDVRYFAGKRFVRDFAKVSLDRRFARSKPNVVVSVGGSRGLNFEILKNFPVIPGDRLILVGRTQAHRVDVAKQLEILEKHWPSLQYVVADAINYEQLSSRVREALGVANGDKASIDVLFNACGYEVSQSFDEKDSDLIKDEFKSKWRPFENLERFKAENSIGKLIHYSSAVTPFGNRGQAVYAYANGLIERECRKSGSIAIGWGPWDGVGMTQHPGIRQRLKEWGISFVSIEAGTALTYRLLYGKKSAPAVMHGFDPKDIFLFTSDRDVTEHPVVGTMQNSFESCFVKEIDLRKEPFLRDHAQRGEPLVPAAYWIATMLSIGRAQFGRIVDLANFEVNNVMIFDKDHCQAKIQAFFREPHDVRVYSVVPHSGGRLSPQSLWKTSLTPVFLPKRRMNITKFFDSWAMRAGPSFRLFESVQLDDTNRIRLEVDTAKFPTYLGDAFFDFMLALSEIAFESVTFQANFDLRHVTIPLKCEAVTFNPGVAFTRSLYVRPVIVKKVEQFWVADVDVETTDGELVCRYIGMKTALYPLELPIPELDEMDKVARPLEVASP